MKTLVIAGNHYEATNWIKKDCERRFIAGDTSVSMSQYVYIHDAIQLSGIANPHGVFIGTWRERKDILDIVWKLICHTNNPTKLRKIHDELYKNAMPRM